MENTNKGIFAAITVVSIIIGILIGLAICGSRGYMPKMNMDRVVGTDFRVGNYNDTWRGYAYRGRLNASVYDSYNYRDEYYYSYTTQTPSTTFSSEDCQNEGTIEYYSRTLGNSGFENFARFCESIGQPIG